MGKAQAEEDLAVKSGYWPLYRYNPALKAEGKNPFSLDSKKPDGTIRQFLAGEIRYASLKKTFPEEAERLDAVLEEYVNTRYETLSKMTGGSAPAAEEEKAAE
jgi:pyruvate-ferredoxin/flavodoxin oxidoreductase